MAAAEMPSAASSVLYVTSFPPDCRMLACHDPSLAQAYNIRVGMRSRSVGRTASPSRHGRKLLTQLSQLAEKSELDQGLDCQGLHYIAVVGECARFPGAVMRGGGCGGKSRLSCWPGAFARPRVCRARPWR